MKKIMFAGVLGSSLLTGCATTPPVPKEPVKLENIYTIENLTKDQIYDGTRQWFAIAFNSANAVIQYEDKKAGTIIGKASTKYTCAAIADCLLGTTNDKLEFTIRVDTKDNRVRVAYSDLVYFIPAHTSGGTYFNDSRRPISPDSDAARMNVPKLDKAVQDMVNKIATQQKVNADW
jgi:hypothetical protein